MSRYALTMAVIAAGVVVAAAGAASGTLDPGFGNAGVTISATAPGAGGDFQNGLAIQRDRRIVVGGESDLGETAGGLQWRVSRYTHKGEPDVGFGTGGTVTTSMSSVGGQDEILWNLDVQPDGKIVAAGDAATASGGMDVALARFNVNGTLDMSFGAGGKVTTAIGPGTRGDRAFDVRVLTDGEILVAGFADMGPGAGGRNVMLARYQANGTLDPAFGTGGVVNTPVAPGDNRDQVATNGLALDGQGRIVVVGAANMGAGAGGFNFLLARYLPNGTLDTSFDGDGIVTSAIAPGDNFDSAISVAIDGSGKIIAAGVAQPGAFALDWSLARYNGDGSLDASFGAGGTVTTNLGPGDSDDDLEEIVIQPTGKILVGGSAAATEVLVDSDFAVARYNADGSLDGTFGSGGIARTNTAAGSGADEIYAVALTSDSKLVVSGECDQAATGRDVCIARYKVGDGD